MLNGGETSIFPKIKNKARVNPPTAHLPYCTGKWNLLSCVWLFAIPWTIQSMEFSRPEYWRGSLSLPQGIFPTQGPNPGLPHSRQILYQLSHQGSPGIQRWVTYPFSRGSSQPRDRTQVSRIAGGVFTSWAIREVIPNTWGIKLL